MVLAHHSRQCLFSGCIWVTSVHLAEHSQLWQVVEDTTLLPRMVSAWRLPLKVEFAKQGDPWVASCRAEIQVQRKDPGASGTTYIGKL